jgi:acyl transferase domain-containing protein
MMDPVLAEFEREVGAVPRLKPQIPMISSLYGRLATDEEWTDPGYWSAQLRRTVRFADALGALLARENLALLEVGPGQTLSALARQHAARAKNQVIAHSCARQDEDSDEAARLTATGQLWLAGVDIKWAALHHGQTRRRVELPTYPFERKRYWIEPQRAPVTNEVKTSEVVPITEVPGPRGAPVSPEELEALLGEQLRIMKKQIDVLRETPPAPQINGKGRS